MRLTLSLAIGLLLATPVLAQDSKSFSGTGANEAKACAAAKSDAHTWARRGKSEGRHREIRSLGECACAPAGNQVSCRIDAQVVDEVYEEEEGR